MPSPLSTFGRNLSNPLVNRARSSTSARNGEPTDPSSRPSKRSEKEKKGEQDEDFFKFREKENKKRDKAEAKLAASHAKGSSSASGGDRMGLLGRVSTNNIPTGSSNSANLGMSGMSSPPIQGGIPTVLTPDGRTASAAGSPISPEGQNGTTLNNNLNLNAPGIKQAGAHRKTSTDSFGSGGLGVMNLDRLTGEQKAVGALVNKLLVKLPLSSGRSIGSLDSDPIVQETVRGLEKLAETRLSVVAHGLTGVLDGLAKQTWNVSSANLPMNMLQTELFLIRTLSSCMDAYWRHHHQLSMRTSPPESVDPDEASFQKPWANPPGIEEPLAKFILSTMILLMRMTTYEVSSVVANSPGYTGPPAGSYMTKGESNHPQVGRSIMRYLHAGNGGGDTDFGFRYRGPHDMRSVEASPSSFAAAVGETASVMKDNTSMILSDPSYQRGHKRNVSTDSSGAYSIGNSPASGLLYEIARTVGKVVFFLSSASWPVIFARIRNRVLYLSSATEEHPDAIELRLLDWCNLDQARLVLLMREFTTHFLHMKRSAQPAVAHAIESIIMNWVEARPSEFVNLLKTGKRLDGGAEVLFDQVHSLATLPENTKRLRAFRPAKMALLIVCPDILTRAMHGETTGSTMTKKTTYLEVLRKNLRSSVVEDAVLQAYINCCRAGAVIPLSMNGTALHELVGDIMRELKDGLYGNAQISEQREDNLLIDGFGGLYLVKPPFCINAVPSLITDAATPKMRRVLATSCTILEMEATCNPQRKSTHQLREMVAPTLRNWLKSSARTLVSAQGTADNTVMRGYIGRPETQSHREATMIVQSILTLYAIEPQWAIEKAAPVPRLGRSAPNGLSGDLTYDHRFGIDVNEDSLPALMAVLSSLTPKAVSDGYRDGVAAALRAIQSHLIALEYDSTLNIGLKRTMNRMNSVLLRDAALRCVDIMLAFPIRSGLHVGISDVIAQAELSLRVWKEIVLICGVSANMSEAFTAIALADVVLLAYLVTNEHEEVERCLRAIVYLGDLRSEAFPDLDRLSGIMEHDMMLWFQFMADLSEVIKQERLSEEIRSEQQKRIRSTLRCHAVQCSTSHVLWDLQYCRYDRLSSSIIQGTSPSGMHVGSDAIPEAMPSTPSHALFQNLTLFLAAFSGAPQSQDSPKSRFGTELSTLLRKWESVLDAASLPVFFETITDLTVADSPVIRYTSVQVGSEVAMPYLRLLILQLSNLMQHSISNGIVERNDAFDMFADNCSAILKGVQERQKEQASDALQKTPELPRLIFMLAHYADEMSGTIAERCRSRIVSQLADGVDCSTLNNVSKASLLLILESWMESQVQDIESEQRKPYASHMRGKTSDECDILRALVRLSDRCTFDADSVRDSRMTPAQLFASHMDFFARHALRVSQASQVESTLQHQLMKQVISNLMVNNADFAIRIVSPKLLLNEAEVRTLYISGAVDVLEHSNVDLVLNPGKPEGEEIKPFTKLLLQRDLRLVKALVQVCSVAESDVLSMAVFRIWEREGSLLLLIKGMLTEEVRMTDSQAQLFRTNSVTTRIVAFYIRTVAFNYFRGLLQPLMNRLRSSDIDSSPATIGALSQMVMDDLIRTMDVPAPVRQVLGLVSAAAMTKFPEARSQAVASFLILRVLCPAIISPERLDLQVPAEHRRTLVQVSKVIINVANNQFFASKEMQLSSLNEMVGKNVMPIAQAMTELGSQTPLLNTQSGLDEDVHVTRSTDPLAIEADESYLRYYITKSETRLALAKNPIVENFIPLIELLRRTSTQSSSNRVTAYEELNRRRGVRHAKASSWFYEGTPSTTGNRIFYYCAGEEDIVYDEAFLKHVLRSLSDVQNWELVIDLTGFLDQPPAMFVERLFAVCPLSVIEGLRTVALFQPNFASFPALKSIFILLTCSGMACEAKVVAVASPSQLMTSIAYTHLDLPATSVAVSEIPAQQVYYDIFFEIEDARQIPILGYYKDGFVVLQSRVKQELLDGMTSELTEVYRIEDVNDHILSKISGPGASPLLRVIKDARRAFSTTSRPRRRFKAQEPQRLTTSVVVLCAALFSLISSDDVDCRVAALGLLRAANECFAFGLSARSLRLDDPPVEHVLRIGVELAKYLPHMSVEMAEELIRLLSHVPPEHRLDFVTLTSAWLGSSISRSLTDGELHAERLKMTRTLTRALVSLMAQDSDDFSWVDPLFQQLGDRSHPDVQEIVLETMISQAVELGRNYVAVGKVARALDICNADGLTIRLATILRKEITSTNHNPATTLNNHPSWKKISCLVELLRVRLLKPSTLADIAAAVPDIVFSLLMVGGLGTLEVRTAVAGLLTAIVRDLVAMSPRDDSDKNRKRLDFLAQFQALPLLRKSGGSGNTTKKRMEMHTETLSRVRTFWTLAIEVLEWCAPSNDALNQWMSRISGLLSSNCFQRNDAVQHRALIAFGVFCSTVSPGEIEDDLLYQLVVASQNAISISDSEEIVVSLVKCLSLVIKGVSRDSPYATGANSLWWLGITLLQTSKQSFRLAALELCQAILDQANIRNAFNQHRTYEMILEKRMTGYSHLDMATGVNFDNETNWGFSTVALLYPGLRDDMCKDRTHKLLSDLLKLTLAESPSSSLVTGAALPLFVALYTGAPTESSRRALWAETLHIHGSKNKRMPSLLSMLEIPDNSTAVLLISFLFAMLKASENNEDEKMVLSETLADAANQLPEIVLMLFGHWQSTLLGLLTTENARILRAVTSVLALGSLRRDVYHHQDGGRTSSRLSVDTNSEGGVEALRELGMISVENLSLSSASSERTIVLRSLAAQAIGHITTSEQTW